MSKTPNEKPAEVVAETKAESAKASSRFEELVAEKTAAGLPRSTAEAVARAQIEEDAKQAKAAKKSAK